MGKKNHLSRLAAPKSWPVKRKGIKWIAKPIPGAHNINYAMPLVVIIRDLLGITHSSKDTKNIVNSGEILVNNQRVRKIRIPVGLFDVLSIPKSKQFYRIVINKKGEIHLIKIDEKDANILPLKIKDKTILKKGKVQLNFTNGWNLLVTKKFSREETLFFDLSQKKITDSVKLEKGNTIYVIKGRHAGKVAVIEDLKTSGKIRKQKIAILKNDKETWETLADNLFVIGKTKPVIKLE